jgi:hypothetical protein
MVPGGACGFMGICGAVTGAGIGFSLILGASPLEPAARRKVMSITGKITATTSRFEAARCCQRECWVTLRCAAQLSRTVLPIALRADGELQCGQTEQNRECIGSDCPLYSNEQMSTFRKAREWF